jgi:flagellar biosynthesis protein FlhG
MNWARARELLGRTGSPRRSIYVRPRSDATPSPSLSPPRAASLCLVSGKGGTGKSYITANLACLFARRGRTLILDADFGVGNAHILQGTTPKQTLVDLVDGRADARAVISPCRAQLDLLPAGSGVSRVAGLTSPQMSRLARGIEELEIDYRFLLIDSAAGLSDQTLALAAASDLVVLVTNPDLTAMTDGYAFLKVLLQRKPTCDPLLVVNRVESLEEGRATADRIQGACRKFLGREPRWVGMIPADRAVMRSVNRRRPLVLEEAEPSVKAGGPSDGKEVIAALEDLAVVLLGELVRVQPRGLGRSLLASAGYSPARS